jgi:Questin oxidase-like
MSQSQTTAMEDALALLAPTGPEYAGRLANHGPMAAEALVVLDRPDAVVPWVEAYRKRLRAHPPGTRPIDPKEWREALGDDARVGDWIVFFDRRIEERPWRDVLVEWVPRLSPGVIAAAFHGVIRTAHATRSLDAAGTPARRRELAEGLGYWAATYEVLPESSHAAAPGALPSASIGRVESLPSDRQIPTGNITDRLAPLGRFPPFAAVADLIDVSAEPSPLLSNMTETFAAVFLANVPPRSWITYVHAVTGPSAIRLLLPHLDARSRSALLRYGWQGAAALYASSGGRPPAPAAPPPKPVDREDLVDRALATGDEHAIKFTEACLREHAVDPKPIYLSAARAAVDRIS